MGLASLVVLGVACPLVGLVALNQFANGWPERSSRFCKQIPLVELSDRLDGPVGLHELNVDGDGESCSFVSPPASPAAVPTGTVVDISAQPAHAGYFPDASPESFVVVPGIGDAAHYRETWGLIFREGDTVVHVRVSRSPFSVAYPQPDLDVHMSIARLVSDVL